MSKELLDRADIIPSYGQVLFASTDFVDVPQFEDGDGHASSNSLALVIYTRSDFVDGEIRPVPVEVWRGDEAEGLGTLLFDGCLEAPSGAIQFGGILDDEPRAIATEPASFRIRAFGDQLESPNEVRFLLTHLQSV